MSGLVMQFLESPASVSEIVQAIEKRRTKGVARTLGFLGIANFMNMTTGSKTAFVHSFGESLRQGQIKMHYWHGLEGTDPTLLACIQSSFYGVYSLLQKQLIRTAAQPLTSETCNHCLAVIEAMSCPLKEVDGNSILNMQFSPTLDILLAWAKGHVLT